LNIVVKLGGFHIILSFLGSIGFFMRGSGLEEVLGVIYGPNVIEHVLSGKDYQRAIRGHFLVHAALTKLLVDVITKDDPVTTSEIIVLQNVENSDSCIMEEDELKNLSDLYTSVFSRKIYFGKNLNNATSNLCEEVLESSCLKVFETKLSSLKQNLTEQCRTSRLWILYMRCVDILEMFLMAERTGNWLLHLHSLYKMLGLFAATGHLHYAKCGRIYLQQMFALENTHPLLHEHFMKGMHTVRRSDRFWAGLSTDLVIEQTLMKSIKGRGGLSHGRGFDENVAKLWLKSRGECAKINSVMNDLVGLSSVHSEHTDVSKARIARDTSDVVKIGTLLAANSPFRLADCTRLISLISGVSSGANDNLNCDKADEVGFEIQMTWNDKRYSEITFRRNDCVKNLATLHNVYKLDECDSDMDANSLFHRLVVLAQFSDDVAACFDYELTPFPSALFNRGIMRKADKPGLYKDFAKNLTAASLGYLRLLLML
jgi:hypothetical protein